MHWIKRENGNRETKIVLYSKMYTNNLFYLQFEKSFCKVKKNSLFETENINNSCELLNHESIFCQKMHQMNALLLNKSIIFFQKNSTNLMCNDRCCHVSPIHCFRVNIMEICEHRWHRKEQVSISQPLILSSLSHHAHKARKPITRFKLKVLSIAGE